MGGRGSGFKGIAKERVEDYYTVKINQVKHLITPDAETVRFMCKLHQQLSPIVYTSRITRTACNYNGSRPWFVCDGCNCRVGVLYGVGSTKLRCRKCLRLNYESQAGDEMHRLRVKMVRIKRRLKQTHNREIDICDKPKYMRWETFSNLLQEYRSLDLRVRLLDCEKLSRLLISLKS